VHTRLYSRTLPHQRCNLTLIEPWHRLLTRIISQTPSLALDLAQKLISSCNQDFIVPRHAPDGGVLQLAGQFLAARLLLRRQIVVSRRPARPVHCRSTHGTDDLTPCTQAADKWLQPLSSSWRSATLTSETSSDRRRPSSTALRDPFKRSFFKIKFICNETKTTVSFPKSQNIISAPAVWPLPPACCSFCISCTALNSDPAFCWHVRENWSVSRTVSTGRWAAISSVVVSGMYCDVG